MTFHHSLIRSLVSILGFYICTLFFVFPIANAQWPCGQGYVLVEHDSDHNIGIGGLPANGPVCNGTPQHYGGGEVSMDGGFVTGSGGYRTTKTIFGLCQTNYLNQITITFAAPQQQVFLSFAGKDGEVLTVNPNAGGATTVVLEVPPNSGGFGGVSLVGDGISSITISTSDPDWDFQVSFLAWDVCVPDPSATPTPTPEPREGDNNGLTSCNSRAGEPVNVTNGNMYLQETDYVLPGAGESINVTRSYNSNSQRLNLFGRGWSTGYDESIQAIDAALIRLNLPDGRAVYFGPSGTPGEYAPLEPDFHARLTAGGNGSFTLTMKDAKVHQFNSAGRLVSLQDLNGDHTLLNYNTGGGLLSIVDTFGRTMTVVTNSNGRVVSIADTLGVIATYSYGQNQEVLSVTYADGSAHQFGYTLIGSNLVLATVTDALGNVLESHSYDNQGRAITSEKQGGVEHYTLNYVSPTQTDVTDALGRVSRFQFLTIHGRNVVTRVAGTCACGMAQIQTWNYDDNLNVTTTVDGEGHRWDFTYDADGNKTGESDYAGLLGFSTYTYNERGQILSVNHSLGGETLFTYDAVGNLLSVTDALDNVRTFTYNTHGQLLTATDARGKGTNSLYDTAGNLVQQTDANNITTFYFYDARSRLTKVRDGLSRSTLYAYDSAGRLEKVTHPDNSFITLTYDLAGRRAVMTDERGNATNYSYDGAYRIASKTDAANHATTYGYDLMSNLTASTDALGRTTDYEYDGLNRVKKVIYPPAATGQSRLFEARNYDAVGNITSQTDTAGRVTTHVYDRAHRLISTFDPDHKTTRFQYDALSRVTAIVDAIDQRYEFAYDALGRQTQITRAGVSMSYEYDAVGNRIQRTDYNGVISHYAYDNLNRLTTITYPTRTATYAYDPVNNLTRATNENGSVYIGYDNRYRVSSFSDPFYYGISYNYDTTGNRTKLKINGATYATYSYDAVNRLTSLKDSANQDFSHSYDVANRITSRTAPNGATASYGYDDLDRLTSLTHARGAATLIDNQYQYNDANNISSWANAAGNHAYAYDPLDRLTSATNSAQTNESYGYDGVGNRTASHLSASYSYQPFNRLTNTATASYVYDNNGNLISKTDNLGTTTFTWNEESQLAQVTLATSLAVNYKYDALGRRIQRTTSAGASERYVYDGQDILLDLNADWSVATTYLNDLGVDNHLRQTNSVTGVSYYVSDHLGSTAGLTDASGNLLEQIAYDSFGNSAGSTRTRYGYTGRERDPDTGLLYYRARFYDPQAGRFISEDPIGLAGGINQFTYVSNSPQNGTDPSGLYELDVHYYLTYFLAMKTGCFSDAEARDIANGDQGTDDNPETRPAYGDTERQQQVNAFYHGLHPGSHQPYLDTHWTNATMGRSGSLSGMGIYLHYLQDTFSHAGYTDPKWGHSPRHLATHNVDKTDYDVEKALRMTRATWDALNKFASEKKCGCHGSLDPAWLKQVEDFAKASSGGPYDRRRHSIDEIDPRFLDNKIKILGVPHR